MALKCKNFLLFEFGNLLTRRICVLLHRINTVMAPYCIQKSNGPLPDSTNTVSSRTGETQRWQKENVCDNDLCMINNYKKV